MDIWFENGCEDMVCYSNKNYLKDKTSRGQSNFAAVIDKKECQIFRTLTYFPLAKAIVH